MAQLGVTTAMVSLVLSAFMVGLGIGSWAAGLIVRRYGPKFPALKLYALVELLIGVSAFAVPIELAWGRELLLKNFPAMSLSTSYFPSAVWLAITLVPWCACMGATFPFMMAPIKQEGDVKASKSFSFLYLPNLIGATLGTVLPLFLIKLFGFHRTLRVAAVLNLLLAGVAFFLSFVRRPTAVKQAAVDSEPQSFSTSDTLSERALLGLLFGTGLTSMGVEVVWVRLFTPSLGTLVYAFAAILGLYLVAMDVGSWIYRRTNRDDILDNGIVWVVLGFSVIVPLLTADPRLRLPAILRVILGLLPFFSPGRIRNTRAPRSLLTRQSRPCWHRLRDQYRRLRFGATACWIRAAADGRRTSLFMSSGVALVLGCIQVSASIQGAFGSCHTFSVFSGLLRVDPGFGGSSLFDQGI